MEVLALTIDEAVKAGGPRRAKLYQEIRSGRLRAVKMGRSTRILVSDLREYLGTLPAIEPKLRQAETQPSKEVRRPRLRLRRS
jgi:excisionase family DNA binding protein